MEADAAIVGTGAEVFDGGARPEPVNLRLLHAEIDQLGLASFLGEGALTKPAALGN